MNKKRATEKKTNILFFALQLGFFAGLIWGGIHWLLFYLNFTRVPQSFLAEPFFKHSFMMTGAGYWIGWLFFVVLSIFVVMIYVLLFRKLKGPWPGIGYGIVWWVLVFVFIAPWMGMLKPVYKLDWDSLITEFCIFLLWGLFIGYTTAIEYTDERKRDSQLDKG